MAHELYIVNGRANMAYVGETPWHGLGTPLSPDSPLEVWTKEAGFDWQIKEAKVKYQANGSLNGFDDHMVLYRDDTGAPLSVVSKKYKTVQPREVIEFFRDLTEDYGYQMETAGMLRNSTRYWALAKTKQSADIVGDKIDAYLLLSTSCDGSLSTSGRFTGVRVVCQNTLSMATIKGESSKCVTTRHSTVFDADKAKRSLGIVDAEKTFENYIEQLASLAQVKVEDGNVKPFFLHVLTSGDFDKQMQRASGNVSMIRQVVKEHEDKHNFKRLWNVYKTAPGQNTPAAKGTMYGAVQAITRYVDHELPSGTDEKRLNSAWFGYGEALKNRAFQSALKVAA